MKEQAGIRIRYGRLSHRNRISSAACTCVALITLLCLPVSSFAGLLFEEQLSYKAAKGDTLSTVGAYFNADWKRIAKENKLDPSAPLKAGKILRITTRKIIPEAIQSGILIDIPGSMLYLFEGGASLMAFPVGLGMPKAEGSRGWETPTGTFTVKGRLKSPDWKVPKSVQEEMKREGMAVRETYPPGPKNPVGGYVLLTTLPGILIHETIEPSSINRFVSHGCVRVLRADMEPLFETAAAGMTGEIVYSPVKIASLSNGRVFMEVNKDVYERVRDMQAEARRILEKEGLLGSVDLNKVSKVVQEQTGVPVDVTAK